MDFLQRIFDTSDPQTFWAAVSGVAVFVGWLGWTVRAIVARREQPLKVRMFASAKAFDGYLHDRWRKADNVKVLHLSSKTLISRTRNAAYVEMLDNFVRGGGIYQRVICTTSNADVLEDAREFLRKHSGKRVSIYELRKVRVDGLRALKVMIIDGEEVCLGGGVDSTRGQNTMSLHHPEVVSFFAQYFAYLVGESTRLVVGEADSDGVGAIPD